MSPGPIPLRNARASAAAPAEARGAQRVDPGRPARVEIGPAPVGAVQLPATVSAADHCSVLLAFHAAAVSRNLDCVFASVDPEGPHQLRIALRRLRVVLRAFEPVMRRSAVTELR